MGFINIVVVDNIGEAATLKLEDACFFLNEVRHG